MKELRSAPIAAGDDMTLEGVAVTFDVPTVIHTEDGAYTEIIARGALDRADLSDVTLRIEHDGSKVPLARTPGTMTLTVTDSGLHVRASLAGDSPQARDAYSAVRRGDLRGMSFAFTVARDDYDPATNTRTILEVAKVYECSICERPAYTQTSIEARSAMRERRDDLRASVAAQAMRVNALAKSISIRERW